MARSNVHKEDIGCVVRIRPILSRIDKQTSKVVLVLMILVETQVTDARNHYELVYYWRLRHLMKLNFQV